MSELQNIDLVLTKVMKASSYSSDPLSNLIGMMPTLRIFQQEHSRIMHHKFLFVIQGITMYVANHKVLIYSEILSLILRNLVTVTFPFPACSGRTECNAPLLCAIRACSKLRPLAAICWAIPWLTTLLSSKGWWLFFVSIKNPANYETQFECQQSLLLLRGAEDFQLA